MNLFRARSLLRSRKLSFVGLLSGEMSVFFKFEIEQSQS